MIRRNILAAASAALLLGLWGIGGCSDEGPRLVPAGGVVEYNGKPVEGAAVTFISENGPSAVGVSGPEGRFRLSTNGIDGVVPGKHTAVVIKMEGGAIKQQIDTTDPEKARTAFVNTSSKPPVSLLPERYANPQRSGLSVDVPAEGTDAIRLQLQD